MANSSDQPLDLTVKKERDDAARAPSLAAFPSPVAGVGRSEQYVARTWSGFDAHDSVATGPYDIHRGADVHNILPRSVSGAVTAAVGAGSMLLPQATLAIADCRPDGDRWKGTVSSSCMTRPFNSIAPASSFQSAGTAVSVSPGARPTGYEHLYGLQQQQQQQVYASHAAPQSGGLTSAKDRMSRSAQLEAVAMAALAITSGMPSTPHEPAARSRSTDMRTQPQQPSDGGAPAYRQMSPGCRASRVPRAAPAASPSASSATVTAAAAAAAAAVSREPLLLHDMLLAAREKSVCKQTEAQQAFMLSPPLAASCRSGAGLPSPQHMSPAGSFVGHPVSLPPPQAAGGRMQPLLTRRSSSPLAWDDGAAAATLQLRPGRLAVSSDFERPSPAATSGGDDVRLCGVGPASVQDLSRRTGHTTSRRSDDGMASEASRSYLPSAATSPAKPGRLAAAGSAYGASVPTSNIPGHLDADGRLDALSKFQLQQQHHALQQQYARSARSALIQSRPCADDGCSLSADGRAAGDFRRGRPETGVGKSLSATNATVRDDPEAAAAAAAAAVLYKCGFSAAEVHGSSMSASTLLPSPFLAAYLPKQDTSADDNPMARLASAGPAHSAVTSAEAGRAAAVAAARAASLSPDSGRSSGVLHGRGPLHVASAATRAGSMPVSMAAPTTSTPLSRAAGRPGAASQPQPGLPLAAFSFSGGEMADTVFDAQSLARRHDAVGAPAVNGGLLLSATVNLQSGGSQHFAHRGRSSSQAELRALATADEVRASAVPTSDGFGRLIYRDAGDAGSASAKAVHTLPTAGLLSSGMPMKRHRGQPQQQQHSSSPSPSTATDGDLSRCVGSISSSGVHHGAARVSWAGEQQQQQRELCYGPLISTSSAAGCTWPSATQQQPLLPIVARLPLGSQDYYAAPTAPTRPPSKQPAPWPSASRLAAVSPPQQQVLVPSQYRAACPSPSALATAETVGAVAPPLPLPMASPTNGEAMCLVKKKYATNGREMSPKAPPQRGRPTSTHSDSSISSQPSPAYGHQQLGTPALSGHRSPMSSSAAGTPLASLPAMVDCPATSEASDRQYSRHSATSAGLLSLASGFSQQPTANLLQQAAGNGSQRPAMLREAFGVGETTLACGGRDERIPASAGLHAPATDAMPPVAAAAAASCRSGASPSLSPTAVQFAPRTPFLSLAAAAAASSGTTFGGVAITCAPVLVTSGAAAAAGSSGGISVAGGGLAPVTTAATVVVDSYSGGGSGYRSGPSSLPGATASSTTVSRVVSKVIPVANVQPFFKNVLTEGCASVSAAPMSAEAPTTPHKPLQLPPPEKHRPAKDTVLQAGGGALTEFPPPVGAPKVADAPLTGSASTCTAVAAAATAAVGGLSMSSGSAWSPPVSKLVPQPQDRECSVATVAAPSPVQHCSREGSRELPPSDVPSASPKASAPISVHDENAAVVAADGERRDVTWSCTDASTTPCPSGSVHRTDDSDPTAVQSLLAASSSSSNLFKRLSQHQKDYSLHPKKRPYVVAECEAPGSSCGDGCSSAAAASGLSTPSLPSSSSSRRGRRCLRKPTAIGSLPMPMQLCSSKRKRRSLLDEIANTEGYVAECDRLPDKRRKLRLATRQSLTVSGSLSATGAFKMKQHRRQQSLKVSLRASENVATTSAGPAADGGSSMLRAWSAKATRRAAADRRRRVSREAQASGTAGDSKRPRISKRSVTSAAARRAATVESPPSASRSSSPPLAVIAGRGRMSHSIDGDDEEEEDEDQDQDADTADYSEENGPLCSKSRTVALAAGSAMRGGKHSRGPPPPPGGSLRSKHRGKLHGTSQTVTECTRSGTGLRRAASRSNCGRARHVPPSRPFARLGSLAAAAAAIGGSGPAAAAASADRPQAPRSSSAAAAAYCTEAGFSSRDTTGSPPRSAAFDEIAFELSNFYLPVYTRDVVAAVGLAEFVLLQDVLQNSRCLLSRDRLAAVCGAPSFAPLTSLRALAGRTVANIELAQRDDLVDPVEILPYSRNLRRLLGIRTDVLRINSVDACPMATTMAEDLLTGCCSGTCLGVGSAASSEPLSIDKKLASGLAVAAVSDGDYDQSSAIDPRFLFGSSTRSSLDRSPAPAATDASQQVTIDHARDNKCHSLSASDVCGTAAVGAAPCRLADSVQKSGVVKCSDDAAAPETATAVGELLNDSASTSKLAASLLPPQPPVADIVSSVASLSAERQRPPLILKLPLSSFSSFSSSGSSSSVPQAAAPVAAPVSSTYSLSRPALTRPTVTLQRLSRELLVSCESGVPSDSSPVTPFTGSPAAESAVGRQSAVAGGGSAVVVSPPSEIPDDDAHCARQQRNRRSSSSLSLPLSLPLTYRQHRPPAADADAGTYSRSVENSADATAAADVAVATQACGEGFRGVATSMPPGRQSHAMHQCQVQASDGQPIGAAVSDAPAVNAFWDADANIGQCCPLIQHFDEDAAIADSGSVHPAAAAATALDSSTTTAAAASPQLAPFSASPAALLPGAAEDCTMPTLTPVYVDDRVAGNCTSFA